MTAEGSHHLIELIHQIFHHTNPRREVPEILFSKPWIQPRPRKWPSSQETPAVRNRIVISVHQNRQFLAEIFFAGGSDACDISGHIVATSREQYCLGNRSMRFDL